MSQQDGCSPYVITIVASMSVGDPMIHPRVESESEEDNKVSKEDKEARRQQRIAISRAHAYPFLIF